MNTTPVVGQKLVYINARERTRLPVEVVSVKAAVCMVKILAGGIDNQLAGEVIRAHVALLHTR